MPTVLRLDGFRFFFFSNEGGGWEYLAFWIAAQVALALTGDGALALKSGLPFAKAPKAAVQAA